MFNFHTNYFTDAYQVGILLMCPVSEVKSSWGKKKIIYIIFIYVLLIIWPKI